MSHDAMHFDDGKGHIIPLEVGACGYDELIKVHFDGEVKT